MRTALVIAFFAATLSVACGGRVPPCAVPTTAEAAWQTLNGTWRIVTWSEVLNGTIHFDRDEVEATSEDTHFIGHWSPVQSTDNAHVIRLSFDEATVDGVRQVWADPTHLEVTVVFATSDLAWGLQPDGAWTRWERIGGCVDQPGGCATIDHPPGALQQMLDPDAVDAVLESREAAEGMVDDEAGADATGGDPGSDDEADADDATDEATDADDAPSDDAADAP